MNNAVMYVLQAGIMAGIWAGVGVIGRALYNTTRNNKGGR